jgi:hypothetical protein
MSDENKQHPSDGHAVDGENLTDNYDVGYKKPPKSHQFKPGQSGNPSGGPKGKKEEIEDVRIMIEAVLDEEVQIRSDGKVRTVSQVEAMFSALLRKALQGNPSAAKKLFQQAQQASLFSKGTQKRGIIIDDESGSPDERLILRAFHAEQDEQSEN